MTLSIQATAPESRPLPAKPHTNASWRMATYSLVGHYHGQNEDRIAHLALEHGYFFGLADGVGGGAHGDIAAEAMLNFCSKIQNWQQAHLLQQQLIAADAHVTATLQAIDQQKGACAFAGAWLDEQGYGHMSWVGDVRIYHASPQQEGILLQQKSTDQTFENLGEQAPSGQQKNLARLVGFSGIGMPVVQTIQLNTAEALILMSDGIHQFVSYAQLTHACQVLAQPNANLDDLAKHIVEMAKKNGSHDDSSILIAQKTTVTENPISPLTETATITQPIPASLTRLSWLFDPPAAWRLRPLWIYLLLATLWVLLAFLMGWLYAQYD